MKIVIPGGSGHVGTILARHYHAIGDDVTVLSRTPGKAPWKIAPWDGRTLGAWITVLEGADVVINLAGRQCELPLHARQSPGNSVVPRGIHKGHRSGHSASVPATANMASGQHRNHLRRSL